MDEITIATYYDDRYRVFCFGAPELEIIMVVRTKTGRVFGIFGS